MADIVPVVGNEFKLSEFVRTMNPHQKRYFLALAMGYNQRQAGRLCGVSWKRRDYWMKVNPSWVEAERYITQNWHTMTVEAFQLWADEYKIEAFEKLMDIALARRDVPVKEQLLALQFYFRMFHNRDIEVDNGAILEKFAFTRRIPVG